MESFRKAYGALKDSTKVGLAKVNSEFKELDIAIVKATNHVERPPKERHVRKIFAAVAISCPRADVGYCIHALSKRLSKTHSWIVAIKCLIVFHRILREGDPSFREELAHFSRRGNLFQISNFKDDSGPVAWDCSAWVRTYALFLEERLQCLRNLNYDTESDKGTKSASGESKSKPPLVMNAEELLEQLPELQQLLYRLVCCQPEGAARHNFVVQYALALVVKESFKVYCAINDGIINLVDTFFEMPKHDAVRALDIYKKAGRQADHLADFYGFCRTLELAQTFQFPTLRQPPPSFLATMEEYIKEASQAGPSGSQKRLALPGTKEEPKKPEEPAPEESKRQAKEVEHKKKMVQEEPVSKIRQESISRIKANPPLISAQEPVDLLGLDEINPRASQIEENNALALAIVQPGNEALPTNNALNDIGKVSGWELALVTTPSNTNNSQVAETKMAGGFNKSLLDSLYDDDFSRRQLQLHSAGYSTAYGNGYNDPFAMTNNVGPAHTDVHHMGMMSQQQQQQMTMHQQHMVMHHHHHHHHQQHHQPQQYNMMMMMTAPHTHSSYPSSSSSQYTTQQQIMPQMGGSFNPFGDPFGYPQTTAMPPHGNHTLL